jgi:hypothetical protein
MKTIEIAGVEYQCYDRMNRKIRSAIAKIQMKYRAPEKVEELKLTHPKREGESEEDYDERIDELFRMNPEMVDFMDEMLCKGYQLIVYSPKKTADELMEMDPNVTDEILKEIILGHLLKLMDKTSDERVKELTKKVDSVSLANDP